MSPSADLSSTLSGSTTRHQIALIGMTAIAVVSDAALLPFAPQVLGQRFGVESDLLVGTFLALSTLVVLLALPLWAKVEKRWGTLQLLLVTQTAACLLGLACAEVESLTTFWWLEMAMFVAKASYLLVYPWLMRTARDEHQASIIGVLAVVVHFGGIVGALAGGLLLEAFNAADIFRLMAAGDALQVLVCVWLLRRGKAKTHDTPIAITSSGLPPRSRAMWRLGIMMLLFYFSITLPRPFLAHYWMNMSGNPSELLAGVVFAIPAMLAVLLLWRDHRLGNNGHTIVRPLLIGILGLLLEAHGDITMLLIGRVLFGWALFRLTVRLEVRMFRLSHPDRYARDFSLLHLFQGGGALLAALCAGLFQQLLGPASPFLVAALGLLCCALLCPWLLGPRQAISFDPDASRDRTVTTDQLARN